MAVPGWLCLGGVPIASNARTLAYAQAGYSPRGLQIRNCRTCSPDFYLFDNDGEVYTNPTTDAMPWVSAAEPESADFAGLYVIDVEGLDIAPLERAVTDRLADGATLGRARYPMRTITVTGILLGRTCQAAQWGLRWLAHELRDNPCVAGVPCGGTDLDYLLGCPDSTGSCLLPGTPDPDPFDVQATALQRRLHRVGLLSGPTVTDRLALSAPCGVMCTGGCCLPVVTFELAAGDPYAYRDAVQVIAPTPLNSCEASPDCVRWVIVPDGDPCPDPCNPTIDCADDPACPTPPRPPQAPLVADPCACDPLQVAITCLEIGATTFAEIGDMMPVLHVTAGDIDLRGLRVTFTPNPLQLPFDQIDVCATCYEINLAFLPAGATWHLDAATKTSTVICPGGQEQVARVSGVDGGPFTWPVFTCPGITYAVCLATDCATVGVGATLRLDMVNRHA